MRPPFLGTIFGRPLRRGASCRTLVGDDGRDIENVANERVDQLFERVSTTRFSIVRARRRQRNCHEVFFSSRDLNDVSAHTM